MFNLEQRSSEINLEKIKIPILDGQAELYYGGKEEGDFKPTSNGFYDRINVVREKLGLKYIFAPSLRFTKRTASITDDLEKGFVAGKSGREKFADEGVVRTIEGADGGIIFFDDLEALGIKPEEVALAGFNADCPFIIGYDEEKRAMFSLHAGLGCLRKMGENDRDTIIDKMIKEHKLNPAKIKIFVTAGIQKCCYGRDDETVFPDALKHWGIRFGDVATEGKRKGQRSLNMAAIIFNRLQSAGVHSDNIEIDSHCTCCDDKHWSNVKGNSQRNLVLVKPNI